MTIRQISAIKQFPIGTHVEGVKGRVTKLGKYNQSKHGDQRPWTMQTLELNDGTGAIEVKFWNLPEWPAALKNRTVYILSTPSDRDGSLCGIMTKEEEYRGQKYMILNTTEKAQLTETEPAQTTQAPPPPQQPALPVQPVQPPPQQQPPPQTLAQFQQGQPATNGPKPTSHSRNPKTPEEKAADAQAQILSVRKQALQRVNLWMTCAAAVDGMCKELDTQRGMKLSADQVDKAISTIFISCDRDKLAYNMPDTSFVDVTIKK